MSPVTSVPSVICISGSSCRSTLELGSYGRCFASPYSPRHAFGRSLTRPLLASLFGLVHRRLIPFLPHSRLVNHLQWPPSVSAIL